MRSRFLKLFISLFALVAFAQSTSAQLLPERGSCAGRFINPISDVCWECLAPITLGSIEIFPSSKFDYDNPSVPVCLCGIRPGISIGFWEPRRLIDVTKKAWCFPSLGGLNLDPGIGFPSGSHMSTELGDHTSQWQSHYYLFPLLYWLELITDVLCVEAVSLDIGYVTELDPLWQDDALSMIVNPEVVIFANPAAILACTADCVSSTAGRSNKTAFWCLGCQGNAYPFNGNIVNEETLLNGAITAGQRMLFKLHRQLIAFTTAGKDNLCAKAPQPLMDKRQYRFQMTYPRAKTSGPFTCPNIGFPTPAYDTLGTTYPIKGEDFGFLLWGKRNCCAL